MKEIKVLIAGSINKIMRVSKGQKVFNKQLNYRSDYITKVIILLLQYMKESDYRTSNKPLTTFRINRAKLVIAHFIHEAIEQGWRTFFINTKLSLGCIIVGFFNMLAFFSVASNTNHPQEFINI